MVVYPDPTPTAQLAHYKQVPEPESRTGKEVSRFTMAMAQLAGGSPGRAFIRLNRNADYAAQYATGYAKGRSDGIDDSVQRWMADYAEVLGAIAEALLELAKDPRLRQMLTVATIHELLIRPVAGGPPVWQDARYSELVKKLRPPAGESNEARQTAAELLEAAAYADAMLRMPRRIEPEGLLDAIDLTIADLVAELTDELSSLMADLLARNCKPYEQGYFAGSWIGQACVNTFRTLVESELHAIGTDPTELFLPIGITTVLPTPAP